MVKTKTEINKIINDAVDYLKGKIHIRSIYLFGSYVSGGASEWSDIDLAVFSPDVDKMNIEDKASLATELRLHCHTGVEWHFFPQKKLKDARPTNFIGYIMTNGKKIL